MSMPSTSIAPDCGSYSRHSSLARVVLPAPFWPTMASDDPAGIVRSKPWSTGGASVVGYPNVRSRKRISRAGSPLASRSPDVSAPAGPIAGFSLSTAATGAADPSSAQLRPPNAIIDVPIAAWAKTTTAPSWRWPASTAEASDQSTMTLATATMARLDKTDCSRIFVASYCSSCRRVRRATKRSIVQPTSPNIRSSLAAGGSTASRYA